MLLYLPRFLLLTYFLIDINGCIDPKTPSKPSDNSIKPSGFSIKGVSVVAPVKKIDSTGFLPITKVNANSIAVMPYAFCSPDNPVIRYNHKGQWWGESDEGVIGTIQLAHQRGLTVMLKPHLWIAHGIYTGEFAPDSDKDWELWEASYRNYILHFAAIADSMKAEIFCIGTELGATTKARPAYWRSLIDSIKERFHGKLTYAANWDDYPEFPFWKKLDYIGVDAYFPLATDKTPKVNSIKEGWQKHMSLLEKISGKYDRPVLFTEYGYRNIDNTTAEPWKENVGDENNDGQANAFEGFYQSFADKKWFLGGFVWKWYIDEGRHPRNKIDFTPQGKQAQKVIENWYSGK